MKSNTNWGHLPTSILLIGMTCTFGCSSSDDSGAAGSGGSGSAGAAGSSNAVCTVAYERKVGCDSSFASIQDEYMASCESLRNCLDVLYVPEFVAAYWPCANQLPCSENDDDCGLSVFESRYADPTVKSFADACFARQEACGDSFSDDSCSATIVLKPTLYDAFSMCIEKPCDQIIACIDSLEKAEGCDRLGPAIPPPVPPG